MDEIKSSEFEWTSDQPSIVAQEIDLGSMMSSMTYSTITNGGYSIPIQTGSSYTLSSGAGNYYSTSSNVNITSNGIDMAAGTDVRIDGKSLKQFMDKMEERLAILVPDPKKLEKFEALKKAYDNYKLIESLCQIDEKEIK